MQDLHLVQETPSQVFLQLTQFAICIASCWVTIYCQTRYGPAFTSVLLRLVFLKHHLIGGSEPAESKVKLLLKAVSLLGESEEAGLGEAHLEGQALGTGGT